MSYRSVLGPCNAMQAYKLNVAEAIQRLRNDTLARNPLSNLVVECFHEQ
jgi:hypothetical protein